MDANSPQPWIRSHFDNKESLLLSEGAVPSSASHPHHKGTPREIFVRNFLASHLSENLTLGTGEIITPDATPDVRRPQLDVIIFRRAYPKIDFGGDIEGVLAESVVATIEVKSKLTKLELQKAVKAARTVKEATSYINRDELVLCGYNPPAILNYVVAYDGPSNMRTVGKWIASIHQEEGIAMADLPADHKVRLAVPSPALDAVFVLGRGFAYFDNVPLGFLNEETRARFPSNNWLLCNANRGNLLVLFMMLTQAAAGLHWVFNIGPYVEGFSVGSMVFIDVRAWES